MDLEIFYLSYHNTKMLVQYFLDNGFLMLYEKIVNAFLLTTVQLAQFSLEAIAFAESQDI